MREYNVLITCMGGYGALNLADDIRTSSLGDQIRFFGSHADRYMLARSTADVNFLIPWAKDEEAYVEATRRYVSSHDIDLLLPKSDPETYVVSKHRDSFDCAVFLPDHDEIVAAQDKLSFADILREASVGVARTFGISSIDDLADKFKQLPDAAKYWVRVKTAGEAGGVAATWVENVDQAAMWITLWQQLCDTPVSEFTVSEFLPGRLFECLVLYREGTLKVAKIYENIRYSGAGQRLSGMSSTPEIARTCRDDKAVAVLDETVRAIEAVARHAGTRPNGVYHLSAKEDYEGRPCITESNIGRFPSTCAFFDRTGRYNTSELYVRYGLGLPIDDPEDTYDLDERDLYMIRSLDKDLELANGADIDSLTAI